MDRMRDRVAVITGGASGMGEATTRRFIDEGARVVIADQQDVKGIRWPTPWAVPRCTSTRTSPTKHDVQAAVQRAVDEFGRLDVMFNNAGFGGAIGPIEETPVEEYDRTMNVLLRGVFLGMKHAAPMMKRQGGGAS